MSRPIVVIVCMDAPPNRGSFNSAHIFGTHVPGGGAVHSINSGLMHRSNKPSYSITSSASESSMGDGWIPSERAVLRLSAKASLVGRRTGMSAGFSPRNMRAA